MSEAQFSEFIFLEPRDGIVFVQRDIDRSSRPTFDQSDLHVDRASKRRARKLSTFHVSTG
jgi:hypothetical protein